MLIDLVIPDVQNWLEGKYSSELLSLLSLDFTIMFTAARYFLSSMGGLISNMQGT